jgi:hypothetical protein
MVGPGRTTHAFPPPFIRVSCAVCGDIFPWGGTKGAIPGPADRAPSSWAGLARPPTPSLPLHSSLTCRAWRHFPMGWDQGGYTGSRRSRPIVMAGPVPAIRCSTVPLPMAGTVAGHDVEGDESSLPRAGIGPPPPRHVRPLLLPASKEGFQHGGRKGRTTGVPRRSRMALRAKRKISFPSPWHSRGPPLSVSVLESSFACHAIAVASRGTRMRRVVESKRFGTVRSIDMARGPGVAVTGGVDMVVRYDDCKC